MGGDDCMKIRWAELGRMDRAALRVAWGEAFGEPPTHFLSMIFMRKALIWHDQNQKFGGLKPDLRRALKAAAVGKKVRVQAPQIRAGTQLVREWNGRRYQVEVTEGGFEMNGEHFRSLSAIALRITGATWSGPRFFGLAGRPVAGA